MILIAVFLDYLLGEPRRWHPLAGFGRLAVWVEGQVYGAQELPQARLRLRGALAWGLLVLPFAVVAFVSANIPGFGPVFEVLYLYAALGSRSLVEHAHAVMRALHVSDVAAARHHVGMMVSRDTSALDEKGISRATVESVLENGCDAVFGALFWFVVFGAPGVVVYRLSNTLDAMWGYRNSRYLHFGMFAARMDDVLNWIPARLTALSYALVGRTRQALVCWREQGRRWESGNAGSVMASGAGALERSLGGPAVYHGSLKPRPALGIGLEPNANDIRRSVALVQKAQVLWLGVIFIGGILVV